MTWQDCVVLALFVALAGVFAWFVVKIVIPVANYQRAILSANDLIEARVASRVKIINKALAGQTTSTGAPPSDSIDEPPPIQTSFVDDLHELHREMGRMTRAGAPSVRDDWPDPPEEV